MLLIGLEVYGVDRSISDHLEMLSKLMGRHEVHLNCSTYSPHLLGLVWTEKQSKVDHF